MGDAVGEQDLPCPSRVGTAREFAQLLTAVRERAGLSVREAAAAAGLPSASAGGYFAGRHLPPVNRPEVLAGLLGACGVHAEEDITLWLDALRRVRRARGSAADTSERATGSTNTDTDVHARTNGEASTWPNVGAHAGNIADADEPARPEASALDGPALERPAAERPAGADPAGPQQAVFDARRPQSLHDAVWLAAATTCLDEGARQAVQHLFLRLDLLDRLGRLDHIEGPTLRWEDLPVALAQHVSIVPPFVAAGLLTTDGSGITLTRPLRRHWVPLRVWVSADPDAARILRRLIDRAADWRRESHDPSHLLRGALLATTLRWATPLNRRWLSHTELSFLTTCESAQQREHPTRSLRSHRTRLGRRLAAVTLLIATGWVAAAVPTSSAPQPSSPAAGSSHQTVSAGTLHPNR